MPVWNLQIKGMKHFNLIRYYDPNTGEKKYLQILNDLSEDWERIGEIVGFRPPQIEAIGNTGSHRTSNECLHEVITRWLQNADNMPFSKRFPSNWIGVYNLLEDSKHNSIADDLKSAIEAFCSDLHENFNDGENFYELFGDKILRYK